MFKKLLGLTSKKEKETKEVRDDEGAGGKNVERKDELVDGEVADADEKNAKTTELETYDVPARKKRVYSVAELNSLRGSESAKRRPKEILKMTIVSLAKTKKKTQKNRREVEVAQKSTESGADASDAAASSDPIKGGLKKAMNAYSRHIAASSRNKQRPRFNLSVSAKALESIQTSGIDYMRYAKGPDGTNGFKLRRSVKRRKRVRKKEVKKEESTVETSTKSLAAMTGVLLSLRFLSFKRQFALGNLLSRFCRANFCLYVQRIDLRACAVGPECLRSMQALIPRCPYLEEIDLSCLNLGDRALLLLQALPRCPRLRSIQLYANHIGVQGAMCLSAILPFMQNLETLGLAWNDINDEGIRVLCNGMQMSPKLKRVDVRYNAISKEALMARGETFIF